MIIEVYRLIYITLFIAIDVVLISLAISDVSSYGFDECNMPTKFIIIANVIAFIVAGIYLFI